MLEQRDQLQGWSALPGAIRADAVDMPERVGRRTRELRREEQQPHPVTQPRGRDQRPEPELRHGAGPWPTHDELLSFGVQILVAKRRRIDGIE